MRYNSEVFMHGNQRETDWAYMAGIMDADGCFMITKHNRNKNSKWNLSPTYLPCLKISMAEKEAIDFITSALKIGSYKLDRARIREYKDGKRFGGKPMYDWFMRNKKQIIPVLERIIPYLKVKKERAIHMLNYCLNVLHKPGRNKLSQVELNYREDSYRKMREFNGNKVPATTKS